MLVLNLSKGWRPQLLCWRAEKPFLRGADLDAQVEKVKTRGWKPEMRGENDLAYYELPLANVLRSQGEFVNPWKNWGVQGSIAAADRYLAVQPWFDWGTGADCLALARPSNDGQTLEAVAGLLVLHTGSWRRPYNSVPRLKVTDVQTLLELPISCFGLPRPWNPFDTSEEDPSAPASFGRRVWGLIAGSITDYEHLRDWRMRYGFIGLDRYKDWVLSWDMGPVNEGGAGLDAIAEAVDALGGEFRSGLATPQAHYRQAQNDAGVAAACRNALAKDLTQDARERLCAKIAARCYMLSDPDFSARGAGVHLGNPNMPINRGSGLALFATLLPTHPRYAQWIKESASFIDWKLAHNTAPSGAWIEEMGYQQAAVPHLVRALTALKAAGEAPESAIRTAAEIHKYMLALISPRDINQDGKRACEGTGHGGRSRPGSFRPVVDLVQDRDPELAAEFRWAAAELTGENRVPRLADLPGTVLPGFGATLRAHFDTPNETFLLFRQGYNQSHYWMDQGTFKFYAYGELLLPNSGHGYGQPPAGTIRDGRLTFGNDPEWEQNHGRVDSMVLDDARLETVDHLLGRQRFDAKSNPAAARPFDWYRQFLMLKSRSPENPTYLVLRDVLRGEELPSTHWQSWVLSSKDRTTITGNRVTGVSTHDTALDFIFLEPAAIEPRLIDAPRGEGQGRNFPGATQARVDQSPGKGYLLVLYPRKAAMPVPEVQTLAPGVLKIATQEGTDYAFISPDENLSFDNGELSFSGRSGAIRLLGGNVHFAMTAGSGAMGYKGTIVKGDGPFERVIPLAEIGRKTTLEQPAKPAIMMSFHLPEGDIAQVQPGVKRVTFEGGYAYLFDSPTMLSFRDDRRRRSPSISL